MATERIQTFCAMCTSRCGVIATVEDGRLAKVERDPDHPNGCICIKGTAAPEMVYSPYRITQPMMRTRPKGDADPGWKAISWDEAMAMMAKRLNEIKQTHGPEAVVFGRATPAGAGTAEFDGWLQRMGNAFGTPNLLATTHICNWHRVYGSKYTFGTPTPPADYDNTNCILLWGNNPQASAPDAAMRISRARARGAKLIVIDPRENDLAKKADCWLRVRPGADGALALAMIHVLLDENLFDADFVRDWTTAAFLVRSDDQSLLQADAAGDYLVWDEGTGAPANPSAADVKAALSGSFSCRLDDGSSVECRPALELLKDIAAEFAPEISDDITGIAPEDVRRAARMFALETPSSYATWVGLEQHGDAMQTNRAVGCFYGLTGQFDSQGSNVLFASTPARPMMARNLLREEAAARRLGLDQYPLGPPSDPGIVTAGKFYNAILDGEPYPVKAAVCFGGDTLMNAGDVTRGRDALMALDFYVHMDIFANNSAAFADLLLPACTTWENEAVKAFFPNSAAGGAWAQLRKAVIPARAEARTDMQVLFDLAVRLGLGEHFFGGDTEAAWNAHLEPAGITVAALRAAPGGIETGAKTRHRKYAQIDDQTGKPKGFNTPSGRLEIYSIAFAEAGYAPLPDFATPRPVPEAFPLALTFFRQIQFINQQNRNIPRLRRQVPETFIEVHPDTAGRFEIAEGDPVLVETAHGGFTLKAKFNPSLHPQVVATPYGWWQECKELNLPGYDAFSAAGANVNRAIPSALADDEISSSVPYRSQNCRIRKAV
jgi:anaerobic selenocysteine-containing dehydrogenase